jgi:hypothetical protein
MKNPKVRAHALLQPADRKPRIELRTFRTQAAVGDVICFDPTGEQLRITKIERDSITFEKVP